jgi:hypothetical protein
MEGSSETWYAVPRNPSCIRLRHLQVSADGKGFLKGIGLWFALAVPSTYTNTMVCLVIYPATASLADVRLPAAASPIKTITEGKDADFAIYP